MPVISDLSAFSRNLLPSLLSLFFFLLASFPLTLLSLA